MPSGPRSTRQKQVAEQAADWALREREGALSTEERRALELWLEQDEARGRAFERAKRLLEDVGVALADDPELTKDLVRESRGRGKSSPLLALAFVGGGLGVGAFFAADGPLWLSADLVSAANETPRLELPDGSHVRLNGETAITLDFDDGARRVELLKGEAFFEVASDPDRPFVVEAGAGRIVVLGTAFDVNMVAGDVEVVVAERKVAVAGDGSGAPASLSQGERVSYDDRGVLRPVETVPEDLNAPWRFGRLVFEDRSLDKVIEEIFRHLPDKVVVARSDLAGRRVSGSFDLGDPEAALSSFAEVFGFRLARAPGLLTVVY